MALYRNHFYHQSLRNYVIAFGNLFTNVQVVRYNTDGSEGSRERVPIAYSSKEKFYTITDEREDRPDNNQPAVKTPRMGFEITGLNLTPERRLGSRRRFMIQNPGLRKFNFYPVPYDVTFNLYILAKTTDEGNQIAEQILPFFQPDYSLTVNILPELQVKLDLPIILNSSVPTDTYEGDFLSRRMLQWDMSFTVKGYFYGPIREQGPIRESNTNLINGNNPEVTFANINIVPNPIDAELGDDFGFTTTITEFNDDNEVI